MNTERALSAQAVIAFLAALLLTGCAGEPNDTSAPSQPGSSQQGSSQQGSSQQGSSQPAPTPDAQAYAQCMRDHGVDMADPDPATGLPQFGDGVDPDSPAVQEAIDACQDLMPAGARVQGGDEDMDSYLAFAQCMRENGVPDFPDPQPGSGNGMFGDSGVDRDDPGFQQAAQACQHLLGGE